MKHIFPANAARPLGAYAAVVAAIIISKAALSGEHALLLSAGFMLSVPFLLDPRARDALKFDARWLVPGAGISLAALLSYVACIYLLSSYLGKTIRFTEPTASFVLTHLALVAFPEEFFFRGYLQKKLGGGWEAVVAASVLFALAHLLVICVFSGGGACLQNGLTFFPSLLMGYLYMKTGTIWPSVFFHFAANIVYLSFRFV